MKYDVTFSCGHTETVELFGKSADRERRIEWYKEHGVCTECYKKQQAERQSNANKALKEKFPQLPTITGVSENQVKYAEDLRRGFLNSDKAKEAEKYLSAIGKRIEDLTGKKDENCEIVTFEWMCEMYDKMAANPNASPSYVRQATENKKLIISYRKITEEMSNAQEIIDTINSL